jgi:uncharacterized protein (UPF0276 family)
MQTPLFGLGFRTQHAAEIARDPGPVDWFEVLSDHYIGVGGPRRALLERLRQDHPLALHGVSLSIAGSEPLDREYLDGLAVLAAWLEPVFVSDHLCWTAFGGRHSHDLLPVACTREALAHVAERVAQVQERLGRRLLLENASAYVAFRAREMEEAEFLAELSRRTGCGLLLDVNNLVVNAANLGSDPKRLLEALPADAVGYLHLAGHAVLPDVRIDTHDADVPDAVWTLFEAAARRFPAAGVILERDDNFPEYRVLVAEVGEARARHAAALQRAAGSEPQANGGGRASAAGARSEPQASGGGRASAAGAGSEPQASGGGRASAAGARSEPQASGGGRASAAGAGSEPQASGGGRASAAGARSEPQASGGGRASAAAARSEPQASGDQSWPRLQRDFFARIVDRPLGAEQDDLGELLDESLPVRAARGLRVYSDAYTASLREALATNFPALARVLSPADFERLAAAYLRAHPPRGFDYLRLGAHLADFVAGFDFAADYGVARAALSELAALEQAQLEVQDAPDPERGVTPEELAALAPSDWERARVAFAPAFRVVRTTHDVAPDVEAVAAGRDPARSAPGEVAYLVARAGAGVRTVRLLEHEARVLEALLAGEPFAAACAGDERAARDVARRLVEAAAAGLLARVGS